MSAHLRTAAHLLAARAETRWLLDSTEEIRSTLLQGGSAAFLLDFDGALAAIADEPDSVHIPERIRTVIEHLASLHGSLVGIISGRALSDIRRRIGIKEIVYAGNHGLEMAGADWGGQFPRLPRPARPSWHAAGGSGRGSEACRG